MNWSQEFENALSWFAAAPKRLTKNVSDNLQAAAEWLWVVLQGDFADEQTTAQTVTTTVISMIPFVDQICDVRDLVANARKINEDSNNTWAWGALVLTLIGLFPTLGSLFKGCFKILFAYLRKGVFQAGTKALNSDAWKAIKPWVENGIQKLNEFLARPAVRKLLSNLEWDNIYKILADKLREVSKLATPAKLLSVLDDLIGQLKKLVELIQNWGSAAMATRAGEMLRQIMRMREMANWKLAEVLKPVQELLDKLAQRLDLEHRLAYKATTNASNLHDFKRASLEAEIETFQRKKPGWADVRAKAKYPALDEAPRATPPHADISAAAPKPLNSAFDTFHNIQPDIIPPGTVIYRVLDPGSLDNSTHWMTEAEFRKLLSKDDWRRRFAVWENWNYNGEYVTYTVPPGGLPVWRGKAASQQLKTADGVPVRANAKGEGFFLEGGAEQILVNPADLDQRFLNARRPTGWGYDELGEQVSMIGVPVLTTNWRESDPWYITWKEMDKP